MSVIFDSLQVIALAHHCAETEPGGLRYTGLEPCGAAADLSVRPSFRNLPIDLEYAIRCMLPSATIHQALR